jgi:hypothetical protein
MSFQKGHKSFLTDKSIKKIKIGRNGRKPALGKHWKVEDTSRMNKSKKGIKLSEITREKMGIAQKKSYANGRISPFVKLWKENPNFNRGENSPVWVNGNYKRYDKRNDSAYQEWVKAVKKRDNNECKFKNENCFGDKIAHHILPWRDYPEERYNINNGITLCQYHHPLKRVDEQRLIPIFQELVEVR